MKIINADHLMERLKGDPLGQTIIENYGLDLFIEAEPALFRASKDCERCELQQYNLDLEEENENLAEENRELIEKIKKIRKALDDE